MKVLQPVLILALLWAMPSFSQQKELPYFIEKAKSNSPLLTDLDNQAKSAALDSLINLAGYRPQLSANLSAYYAPVIKGYGYDTALSNGQSVNALVGYSQKIFGARQRQAQSGSYRLIKEALRLNRKIAVKDLDKAVTAQYITAWGMGSQITFNQKILSLLQEEEKILRKLAQNAIYRQTDYLIFDATVRQQSLAVLRLKQQYQNDLALLNYISGENDTISISLKKPEMPLGLYAEGSTVFLRQFETDSLKLLNDRAIMETTYKPSVSLLADAGYSSTFVEQAYKNFGGSVGFGIRVPIYDGNQRSLQRQKNAQALQSVAGYKKNFRKQYAQQLFMLEQKLRQAEAVTADLDGQLKVAEALIEADKKLLASGDVQITEYILAISNLITVQNDMAQSQVDKLQVMNELKYWKTDE